MENCAATVGEPSGQGIRRKAGSAYRRGEWPSRPHRRRLVLCVFAFALLFAVVALVVFALCVACAVCVVCILFVVFVAFLAFLVFMAFVTCVPLPRTSQKSG